MNARYTLALSKTVGVLNMRVLVEHGLREYATVKDSRDKTTTHAHMSTTHLLEQFVADHVLTPEGALRTQPKAWLRQLEPGIAVKSVAREMKDLYHELSKLPHFGVEIEGAKGLFCAGDAPLRPAVAILVLALQTYGKGTVLAQPIKYARHGFHVDHVLLAEIRPQSAAAP